ncbi:amino acid ABC transporter permease [Kaistia dalseonensis]|uniref:Polar amino acid transport system permease protein n=1 Tax=Kaistia dalseonensis TaxID=410840 RepID=A0ABU0H2V9_9HYPH|nr:amino acid ABC transporter permease [Kaistia dalseonensis]MCX5494063.1 amino acid ABC transporter permease [Kaistia dalseonensis]MDQ0436641.1 polar amino acid transport system permease protein [Kaistia dalseonensis]
MSLREFGLHEVFFLLMAARWTVLLALVTFVGGGLLGLVIAALRVSPTAILRHVASGYIGFMQSTPILIQLFMVYYGSSFIGLRPDPWPAAAITFCLNAGAFFGEIFRGSIESVPKGQWEASKALGLRYLATLRLVIIPQAMRLSLPPTVGFMVQIVKTTSVASLIGLVELSRTGTMINTVTFQPVLVFGTVAAIYFALCWPLSLLGQHLERRLIGGRERRVAL